MSKSIKMAYMRTRPNPDFAVNTIVEEVDGKLLAKKIPTTKSAQKHILKMKYSYDLLAQSKMSDALKIAAPVKSSAEEFTVDYIKGESLEHKLQGLLFANDLDGFIFELDKLKQLIDSLSTEKADSKLPFANSSDVTRFNGHLAPGIIDINADNILVDKNNQWHLFDYEWCFDGTAPKDYVFVRGIYWFFQRATYGMLSINCEYVKITETVFLPKKIYQHYKNELSNLEAVLALETKFQAYVDPSRTFDDAAIKPKKFTPEPILTKDKFAELQQGLANAVSIIEARDNDIALLKKHIKDTEESKSYKLARKISGGYNKIKG